MNVRVTLKNKDAIEIKRPYHDFTLYTVMKNQT